MRKTQFNDWRLFCAAHYAEVEKDREPHLSASFEKPDVLTRSGTSSVATINAQSSLSYYHQAVWSTPYIWHILSVWLLSLPITLLLFLSDCVQPHANERGPVFPPVMSTLSTAPLVFLCMCCAGPFYFQFHSLTFLWRNNVLLFYSLRWGFLSSLIYALIMGCWIPRPREHAIIILMAVLVLFIPVVPSAKWAAGCDDWKSGEAQWLFGMLRRLRGSKNVRSVRPEVSDVNHAPGAAPAQGDLVTTSGVTPVTTKSFPNDFTVLYGFLLPCLSSAIVNTGVLLTFLDRIFLDDSVKLTTSVNNTVNNTDNTKSVWIILLRVVLLISARRFCFMGVEIPSELLRSQLLNEKHFAHLSASMINGFFTVMYFCTCTAWVEVFLLIGLDWLSFLLDVWTLKILLALEVLADTKTSNGVTPSVLDVPSQNSWTKEVPSSPGSKARVSLQVGKMKEAFSETLLKPTGWRLYLWALTDWGRFGSFTALPRDARGHKMSRVSLKGWVLIGKTLARSVNFVALLQLYCLETWFREDLHGVLTRAFFPKGFRTLHFLLVGTFNEFVQDLACRALVFSWTRCTFSLHIASGKHGSNWAGLGRIASSLYVFLYVYGMYGILMHAVVLRED